MLVIGAVIRLDQPLFASNHANTTDLSLLSENWSFDAEASYFDVKDGIAFKADYMSGTLRAIDATNPQDIRDISVATGEVIHPYSVAIVGNYAYVHGEVSQTNDDLTIVIFDITDPSNIAQVGAFTDPALTPCTSYTARMQRAASSIVVNLPCTNQVVALNLTNPAAPTLGGTFDYSAYIGTASYSVSTTATGIGLNFFQRGTPPTYSYVEVDVTDPNNPSLYAAVPSAPLGLQSYAASGSIGLQSVRVGQQLYLAQRVQNGNTDFLSVDITTPGSPTVEYSNTAVPACWLESMRSVQTDTILLMCLPDTGLNSLTNTIIDVSNPSVPVFGTTFGSLGIADMSIVRDDKLYVSSGYNQMQMAVYDLASPTGKGILLGALQRNLASFFSTGVVVPDSTTAILLSQDELVVQTVDITNPSDVSITSTQFLTDADGSTPLDYAYPKIPQISSSGNMLYLLESGVNNTTRQHNGNLTLIDISDTSNIQLVNRFPSPNNEMLISGKVVGNTWYTLSIARATSQTVLRTYNIDENTNQITPLDSQVLLSTKGTLSSPQKRDVEIIGNNAIISAHQQQVEVVDITDLSNLGAPALSNLPVLNNYNLGNIFAAGGQLLVPVAGYLYSVNASDPMAMTISSTIASSVFTVTSNSALVSDGDQFQSNTANTLIYTNQNGDSHARLDVTNPLNPSLLDSVNGTGLFPAILNGWENVEVHGVFFRGDYAYAVSAQGDGSFYTFNAGNFAQPQPLDSIVDQVPAVDPTSIALYGDYAYLGSYGFWEVDAEMSVYDVADASSPRVVGGPVHEYNTTYSMATQGQYLYAAQGWNIMTVYDLSNPTFPRAVGRHDGALYTTPDINVSGQYVYAADTQNGLVIYDVSAPTNPVHVSSFEDANFTGLSALELHGNYVYGLAPTENRIVIIDVSNRSAPTTVGTVSLAEFDGLDSAVIQDGYLYVAGVGTSSGAHLSIFDLSNPLNPAHVGSYIADIGDRFEDIAIAGNTAFIAAAGNNSIDLLDVTDKTAPQLMRRVVSNTPSLRGVRTLRISGDRLYSAAGSGQSMNIYGISITALSEVPDPMTPTIVTVNEGETPLANTGENYNLIVTVFSIMAGVSLVAVAVAVRRRGSRIVLWGR